LHAIRWLLQWNDSSAASSPSGRGCPSPRGRLLQFGAQSWPAEP